MKEVAIILLAAGASTRFKSGDKLLEFIDGTPLLLQQLRRCCAASADVTVVLPAADRKRRAWLTDSPARIVETDAQAMSGSIRAGILATDAPAAMIVLADMPDVTTKDMSHLIAAWRTTPDEIIQAATPEGQPGQPVIFPARHFAALTALSGDRGAKSIIDSHGARRVGLPGAAAVTDLDTEQDWQAWRARQ